jgi:hypothetical protein
VTSPSSGSAFSVCGSSFAASRAKRIQFFRHGSFTTVALRSRSAANSLAHRKIGCGLRDGRMRSGTSGFMFLVTAAHVTRSRLGEIVLDPIGPCTVYARERYSPRNRHALTRSDAHRKGAWSGAARRATTCATFRSSLVEKQVTSFGFFKRATCPMIGNQCPPWVLAR